MNNEAIQALANKMRDTYESGKPVVAQLQERWQQHKGLLSMMVFMYSLSETDAPVKERMIEKMLEQILQLQQDMETAFATLATYHGLTKAFLSVAREPVQDVAQGNGPGEL